MDSKRLHSRFVRLFSSRSMGRPQRLRLENLEGREVPATITVMNGTDSGTGSLRAAIDLANANAEADTINFAPGVNNVNLTSDGLTLSGNITIDGSTSSTGGVTVARDNNAPAFGIFTVDFTGTVSLGHLTITGGNADKGGGINNNGTLTVSNSTIANNTAALFGGGIYNNGSLTVVNSTLANNAAGESGGGIFVVGTFSDSFSITAITNSTIANNTSNAGGGLYVSRNSGGGTLNNTIVAGNTGGDIGSGAFAGSNNFIGDGLNVASMTGTLAGDPLLGPLQDNGGPTQTMALLAGSPAINAGNNTLAVDAMGVALATDQRGQKRISGNTVDIGAFEVQLALTPTQQITQIRVAVLQIGSINGLTFGQTNSLLLKLDQAILAYDKGQYRVAYNLMGSFYSQVLSYEASGVLSASDATVLLTKASTLRQALLDLGF